MIFVDEKRDETGDLVLFLSNGTSASGLET